GACTLLGPRASITSFRSSPQRRRRNYPYNACRTSLPSAPQQPASSETRGGYGRACWGAAMRALWRSYACLVDRQWGVPFTFVIAFLRPFFQLFTACHNHGL